MAEPNNPSVHIDGNESEDDFDLDNFTCPHLPLLNGFVPQPQPSTSADNGSGTSPNTSPPKTGQGNPGTDGSEGPDAAEIAGTVAKTAGVAATTAVVGTTAATAGLSAVGFSSGGIVAGSMAAGAQAGIGNVVAGSAFATFQSIGATGGFAILGPLGLALGAVGGASYGGYKLAQYFKEKKRRENERRANELTKPDPEEPKVNQPEESKEPKKCSGEKGEHLVRGVNICDECWFKLQRKLYNRHKRNNTNLYLPD